ncbi:MAG: hypothetical protein U1E31_00030 [Rickettsiales bacterium]
MSKDFSEKNHFKRGELNFVYYIDKQNIVHFTSKELICTYQIPKKNNIFESFENQLRDQEQNVDISGFKGHAFSESSQQNFNYPDYHEAINKFNQTNYNNYYDLNTAQQVQGFNDLLDFFDKILQS